MGTTCSQPEQFSSTQYIRGTRHLRKNFNFGLGGDLSATPVSVADNAGRALGEHDCLHE